MNSYYIANGFNEEIKELVEDFNCGAFDPNPTDVMITSPYGDTLYWRKVE